MSEEYNSVVIVIPKDKWTAFQTARHAGMGKSANFTCPKCSTEESLIHHDILSDGRVIPNVSCSNGFGFEAQIKLEGWE